MLFRKMLRDYKANFGAFFSVFLLAALAMALFCTFEGHVLSQKVARENYHKECNLSDVWMYGEGFSGDELDTVKALDFVEDAQLRMSVTGSAPDCDGAQVDLYLERENLVDTPYYISGEPFDPTDTNGVWLANAFAKLRNIKVGDDFTIEYNGITFTRKVKGLIESAEYEFREADGDADMYLENIAIAYMSYDAFPIRDYINHMIDTGKITWRDVKKNTTALDEKVEQLKEAGLTEDDITQEMLGQMIDKVSDEKLAKIMPYTQMIIVTTDGGGLAHEEVLAESIDRDYSAIVDRKSIPGLARLDSELEQHQSFSYLFVIIFVGIAILVIATSMGRMVEQQRTQIGTMNALGLKRHKIMLHYISFSLVVSVVGVVLGLLAGTLWGSPAVIGMFANWYIVPGLHSVFHPMYFIIAAGIVAVCVLASYMSCRKLLRIKPAEALRPAAPKKGKNCIFEKLPFWEKLSFTSQYNLRDISRAKLRSFMCVIGTAVGMLLMVYAVGCNELLGSMVEINFNRVSAGEYQIKFSEDAKTEDADAMAEELDGEVVMVNQIEVAEKKNAPSEEKKKETITVLEGKNLYNILDLNNQVENLTPGTVGISRKLAEDLHVEKGDTIYWHLYSKNTWYEAEVGTIYRSLESQGIAYLREDYEKTGAEYTPGFLMTNEREAEDKADLSYVTGVNSKSEMQEAYENSMSVINMMVVMMAVFSILMIVVVLYNSGVLSFHERVKEFATLKVLGLRSSKIRKILSMQNLWLSIIGILIGAPLGNVSLNAMINTNGENFDYNLMLAPVDYVIAGIFVMIISMLVSFMFSKRIRKLDMVETLKGVE